MNTPNSVAATFKIVENVALTDATFLLRLERNNFEFNAGQCVSLGVPGAGVNREYSIYSGINSETLDFIIREVTDGTVSSKLRKLGPGANVEINGPFGEFVINPEKISGGKFLFIASGTGIAPFHSFVASYPDMDYTLLHGIRKTEENYGSADYKAGSYLCCLSKEDPGERVSFFKGRVTTWLNNNEIAENTNCYLCGNSAMINETYDILRTKKISGTNLHTESFF